VTTFTLVPGYSWDNVPNVWWENERKKELTGLAYDVNLSTEVGLRIMRIEAEGYLPEISRRLKDDEEEAVVHFALRKGAGISGVIRLPDASPLAGAEVMLTTQALPAVFSNGRFQPAMSDRRIVRSRMDGRFILPPSEPPYTIVVIHDQGLAERTIQSGPAPALELTIEPWSRVEGTLQFGRQPAGEQKLSLERVGRSGRYQGIVNTSSVTTDAEGRFIFERVLPGHVRVSRLIRFGEIFSSGGNPSAVVDVAPAATVRLTLGGTGRPIIGKAVPPADLADRPDWLYSYCYLYRKESEPEPMPANASDQGSHLRTNETIVFRAEPDGSFRIEDVAAGTYELLIELNKRPTDGRGYGHELLATIRREVVVPQMPGGRSDEVLDLGLIPATAAKKPEPAAPARQS
jgi:hypothetical protein